MITRRYALNIMCNNVHYESFIAQMLIIEYLSLFSLYPQQVKEDLTFTRNQIITSEVNISRIYNWDVRRKREANFAGSK
jgi:hypothetical protein